MWGDGRVLTRSDGKFSDILLKQHLHLQHLVDEVVTEVSSLSVGVVCGEVGTDWGWGATDKK